jgi:Na+-transporting NADH:ubiquinone oxidoreductase subunit B
MDGLLKFIKAIEPDKKNSPFLHTLFDGFFTFAFAPNAITKRGVHVKDGMDLKRTMVHVVIAMQLCYLFGTYNIGHQHFVALGEHTSFFAGFHLKLSHGLIKLLPLFIVSNVVGLGIEFWYAAKKGHAIEEGFLVSGALIPLIMPADLPLWILAFAVVFAVIIGKEAFGGTGMNIFNIALLARVFVFFAYPTEISGDGVVWVSALENVEQTVNGAQVVVTQSWYGWAHGLFDWLFNGVGLSTFGDGGKEVVDSFTGATPMGIAAKEGWVVYDSVTKEITGGVLHSYSVSEMFWGTIPGSIGETSKPLIIIGALFLIAVGIASWRIMLSMVIGLIVTGVMLNGWGATVFMEVPWYYHFYMGSFFFAMAFMATDPVTASSTNTGKWIYGFLIGAIGLIIRVLNPAYPEGWMLAILFMNAFAPTIDYYVLQANINKRLKRVSNAA